MWCGYSCRKERLQKFWLFYTHFVQKLQWRTDIRTGTISDELHWLNVLERVQYKLTVTVYRCLQNRLKRRNPWSTTASQSPMSPVDNIWDLLVDTSLLFRDFDEARSAVGPSLLGVRWLGTHYQTINFSRDTIVYSAHILRYINSILTLTLTSRPNAAC